MDQIGVYTPEQARELWQWYLSQKQLPAQLTKHYPQRRQLDETSPHRVFVKNTTSETIPSYACLEIFGTEEVGASYDAPGRTVVKVRKPTTDDGEYLFNSQFPIPAASETQSGIGWAYRFGVVAMLGDPPSEPNAQYKPTIGEWTIEEGGGAFVVYGEHFEIADTLIGRFQSGGGGGEIMFFSIDEGPVCDEYGVEEPYLLASAVLYSGGCTKTPPGAEYGGKYKIYDRCNLFGAADSMAGANGWAAYMYPQDGYCEPKWYIFQSCAEPECP